MEQLSEEKLFNNFPPVSTQQWEEKINCDLKGADYEKKLVWKTPEGFQVKPYYREEHLKELTYLKSMPGSFPFSRSSKTGSNDWDVRQDISVNDIQEANSFALNILERGVNSLGFRLDAQTAGSSEKFSDLLKDIQFDCISLNILSGKDSPLFFELLLKENKKRGYKPEALFGSFDFDPLGNLSVIGNYYSTFEKDCSVLNELFQKGLKSLPNYRLLSVNASHFNSAGASIVQELAFALAMGSEYMACLMETGIHPDDITPRMQFVFGTGSNYFMEIAKIRAARTLWAKIAKSFGASESSAAMYIHSVISEWNKTIYDPYVNMLRATTEAMSATLGGTDSLEVTPFDTPFAAPSEFSYRIARNTQIILKEEAHFNKVIDPAAGSFYIENLTDRIVGHAWALFLEIEDRGGFSEAFKSGFIQEKVKQTVDQRLKFISTRREILLGTNQFPNFNEKVAEKTDIEKFSYTPVQQKRVAEPVKPFRGAQEFEMVRLGVEKSGKTPVAFMLTIGNLAMRKARSNFSCNFFACAGYEVIDNNGFKTAAEGVGAALGANADLIVLCSSDEEYAVYGPEVKDLTGDKAIVVIAGEPACKPDLESKGIVNFISIKSNVLETLKYYNKLLGI